MFGYGFLSFAIMILCFVSTRCALSSEEEASIKAAMQPFVIECAEEFGVTEDQFEEAKKKGSVTDIDPCFMSCFLKKAEFFDSEGKFDVQKSMSFAKSHLKSDLAINFLEAVGRECVKVNDEDVSDGDKGCDRAKLLFDCTTALKKTMGH